LNLVLDSGFTGQEHAVFHYKTACPVTDIFGQKIFIGGFGHEHTRSDVLRLDCAFFCDGTFYHFA